MYESHWEKIIVKAVWYLEAVSNGQWTDIGDVNSPTAALGLPGRLTAEGRALYQPMMALALPLKVTYLYYQIRYLLQPNKSFQCIITMRRKK